MASEIPGTQNEDTGVPVGAGGERYLTPPGVPRITRTLSLSSTQETECSDTLGETSGDEVASYRILREGRQQNWGDDPVLRRRVQRHCDAIRALLGEFANTGDWQVWDQIETRIDQIFSLVDDTIL